MVFYWISIVGWIDTIIPSKSFCEFACVLKSHKSSDRSYQIIGTSKKFRRRFYPLGTNIFTHIHSKVLFESFTQWIIRNGKITTKILLRWRVLQVLPYKFSYLKYFITHSHHLYWDWDSVSTIWLSPFGWWSKSNLI